MSSGMQKLKAHIENKTTHDLSVVNSVENDALPDSLSSLGNIDPINATTHIAGIEDEINAYSLENKTTNMVNNK